MQTCADRWWDYQMSYTLATCDQVCPVVRYAVAPLLNMSDLEYLRSADTAGTQTQPGTFAAIRAGKIRKPIHCQQEQ